MNDHGCLGPTTDEIRAELADGNPALIELAERFTNTDDLAAWFRTLPHAGWTCIGETGGGSWSHVDRPRVDTHPTQEKLRWERTR